jgi:hypothetical protein
MTRWQRRSQTPNEANEDLKELGNGAAMKTTAIVARYYLLSIICYRKQKQRQVKQRQVWRFGDKSKTKHEDDDELTVRYPQQETYRRVPTAYYKFKRIDQSIVTIRYKIKRVVESSFAEKASLHSLKKFRRHDCMGNDVITG